MVKNNQPQACAIILSGGKSSRMGESKAFLKAGSICFLERQVQVLSAYFSKIVISGESSEYKKFDLAVVEDVLPDLGPMGGLYTVMKQVKAEFYFLLAVDLPKVSKELIEVLLQNTKNDFEIIVPIHQQNIEPLCAVYHSKLFKQIESCIKSQDLSLQKLIKVSRVHYVQVNENYFTNINTREEYQNWIENEQK